MTPTTRPAGETPQQKDNGADAERESPLLPEPVPMYSETQMIQMRAAAYQEGYLDARAAAPVGTNVAAPATADVAAETDSDLAADAYVQACEIMELHQAKRAKRGVEIGTEGSLCDGIEWLYARLEKLERAAGAPAETAKAAK